MTPKAWISSLLGILVFFVCLFQYPATFHDPTAVFMMSVGTGAAGFALCGLILHRRS